jgi:hypothetical protein
VFTALPKGPSSGRWDQDWEWPWIAFTLDRAAWPSAVYFAAVYEVGEVGQPLDDFGRAVERHDALSCLDSNAAMFVVTPREPSAPIAYIVPIATCHAYNLTGGGGQLMVPRESALQVALGFDGGCKCLRRALLRKSPANTIKAHEPGQRASANACATTLRTPNVDALYTQCTNIMDDSAPVNA